MWTTMLITGSREGWNNFFELRCPSYKIDDIDNTRFKSWKDLISFIKGRDKVDDSVIESYEQFSVIEKLQKNKGQAEIHMMALAEAVYDSVNESTPKQLKAGEWHIPFEDKIIENAYNTGLLDIRNEYTLTKVKISTAMAAHTSYTIVGGEVVKSPEKWIELHDKLVAYDPPHSSPLEHVAQVPNQYEYDMALKEEEKGWFYNLKGFKSYRYIIEHQK